MSRTLHTAQVALLMLVVVLISGCAERTDPLANQKVLHRALPADPESLDPQRGRSTQSADVLRDIGEGLLGYDPQGKLIAAGASDWTMSDDGLVYTFTLQDAARWSTGEPVTADDYAAGLRRLIDPATAAFYAGQVSMLTNADAIIAGDAELESLGVFAEDALTLRIELEQPTPYLLSLLTHPATFPVNAAALQLHGDAYARPGNLPSNGAYVLESWQTGSTVQLRRNTHYWDDANTDIDVVRYHIITQEMAELNRFRTGELHMTSTVPPESFEQVRKDYPDELRVAPQLGVYYYGYNLTKPPFKDSLPLRQALSMAVDREVLTKSVTGRGEIPAYSWVPPGVDNYQPPVFSYANLSQAERNAIARSLYRQAGYSDDNPASIELRYNTSDTHQRIALAVQSMWRDVLGVETTLINEEFQVLLANMRAREVTQVFRSAWTGDFNDPYTFLSLLETESPSNLTGYASEEFMGLMQRAAEQTDLAARRLYLEEAERALLRDHPVLPLYFFVTKLLVSNEVRGFESNVLNYHYSHHLSLVDGE